VFEGGEIVFVVASRDSSTIDFSFNVLRSLLRGVGGFPTSHVGGFGLFPTSS